MCGIAGFLNLTSSISQSELEAQARAMAQAIAHRGPDGEGIWVDADSGIGLAHRRLAIVDLSPAGYQPMISHNGRYVMVYNGEIFNAPELQHQLADYGVKFRGHSDTEVILEAISQWGIAETFPKLIGMFGIAVWDTHTRTLTLVRDRFGIKPLYYGQVDGRWMFGSELFSLRALSPQNLAPSSQAISAYTHFGYVPAPYSIYEGIYKLPPGCLLTIHADGSHLSPEPQKFWDTPGMISDGIRVRDEEHRSQDAVIETVASLIEDAVKRRLVADVPVGAFLSGGIDSSLVVAMMQKHSTQKVRTFSIGFEDKSFDEAPYARAVAEHLKTDHTELYISDAQALATAQTIGQRYDEPFADSSQIPTYLVSQLARQHVTVALSGDGGDELFAGYNRYQFAAQMWQRLAWVPQWGRQLMAQGLCAVSPMVYDKIGSKILPQIGDKVHKFANLLTAANPQQLYHRLVTLPTPGSLLMNESAGSSGIDLPHLPTLLDQFQACDMQTYLPDDVLTKVDRASMAVGLEVRVPLLDHRLATLAWRLPISYKYRGNHKKWVLKQILANYVPTSLIERPKMGFGVPLARWLRGPLREWAEGYLDPTRLKNQGIFDARMVYDRLWREHQTGQRNWSHTLWAVLMFQVWFEEMQQRK